MRIHKQVSDVPYHRDEQFTRYSYLLICSKKGCKTKILSTAHNSHLWKLKDKFEAEGWTCIWKMRDPAWIS